MAKQKIKTISYNSYLPVVFFIFFFLPISVVKADSCEDECSISYPNDTSGKEDCITACKKLDKQAKIYEDIIKLKNKQQDTLAEQIETLNQEQEQNRSELMLTKKELEKINQLIERLKEGIKDREASIKNQKVILTSLMQAYYEYDQQGLLNLAILDQDLSAIANQADYIEQSGVKASEILEEIQKSRSQLISDKQKLEKEKEESEKIKYELENKNSNLLISERRKQSLLVETQGEEEKYKKLLERVEEQKKELFNFSEAGNLDEVIASVKNYPKPKDNLASISWYFSQRDSRWSDVRIGNSKSLMKDYGCAVASVAMVFKKKGASIDPGKMAKQKIFYYDLIKWPSSWVPAVSLVSSVGHGNINWTIIDKEIAKGDPVIVYIRKTNGRGGHYVVVTGKDKKDYIVHDPYFGPNLYLGTSKALVGRIGVDSKTTTDQMIIYN